MYLREAKGTNKSYLYLVQSKRVKKRVRQETLADFGALDSLDKKSMLNLAISLLKYCDSKGFIDSENVKQYGTIHNWGASHIIKKLFEKFKLEKLINKLLDKKKIKHDVMSVLELLIASRLCEPESKYSIYKEQSYFEGIANIKLQHIYRSLDFLADFKEPIVEHLFEMQKRLFSIDASIVFYDVTTFYFESTVSDELKDFGYSKDCKFNEVQIVLGILIDKLGHPLGYEIFKGNTYEGNTMKKFIENAKTKFNIDMIYIVADRGLNNGKNLIEIKNAGFNYIVGSRIKNLSNDIKKQILADEGYTRLAVKNEEEIFKYKIIDYKKNIYEGRKFVDTIDEKILCSYSSKRANKDKLDRERLVSKARELVSADKIQQKRGARKYIRADVDNVTLNEEKIKKDMVWDGYSGIETSILTPTPEFIFDAYHNLWQIENVIKTLKSNLEARPVFHWKPKRIRGHFCLCFIALVLERALEIELKSKFNYIPATGVKDALLALQFVKIKSAKQNFLIFSTIPEYAKAILDMLKINIPSPMISEEYYKKIYL